MVEVKILKVVGPYLPGQVVQVDDEMAVHLADGKKAMLLSDFEKMESAQKDPSKLSVKEMADLNMKNIVGPDQAFVAKAEELALKGKPIASGEPQTCTGGVTPPTMVFPAMAKAAGHEVSDAKEIKEALKSEKEKAEKGDKKQDDKKPEEKKK